MKIEGEEFTELLTIDRVVILKAVKSDYIRFVSNLDICNDGTGPAHGDKHHQPRTAYYNGGKYLNADVDKYIVVPPQIRKLVAGVVMGCRSRVTNITTKIWSPAVIGDIGPDNKTGECSYCLAKIVNPSVTHNTGDSRRIYLYELWPDVPATVDGKRYNLEPAKGK